MSKIELAIKELEKAATYQTLSKQSTDKAMELLGDNKPRRKPKYDFTADRIASAKRRGII